MERCALPPPGRAAPRPGRPPAPAAAQTNMRFRMPLLYSAGIHTQHNFLYSVFYYGLDMQLKTVPAWALGRVLSKPSWAGGTVVRLSGGT